MGGPAGASCFTNRQQPGEGLSEWRGRASSGGDGPGASAGPDGTAWTYASIRGMSVPRGVGAVWGQVMSNASARLAEDWGIAADPTDLSGGAGNQRMLLYVAEGVQNAACTPTFTQMRDGIIQAAADNHEGEDVCPLWQVFAAFGLGTSAVSGGPDSTSPTNGFDLPASCGGAAGTLALDASRTDEGAPADPGPDRATTLAEAGQGKAPVAAALAPAPLAPAQGGAGASLPYVELQAENAATNGTIIGPSFIYDTLACEASGRKAVTLAGQGSSSSSRCRRPRTRSWSATAFPDPANGSVYTAPLVALHRRRQAAELHPDQRLQLVLRRLSVHERPRQQPPPLLRRGPPRCCRDLAGRHEGAAAGDLENTASVVHDRLRRLRAGRPRRGRSPRTPSP